MAMDLTPVLNETLTKHNAMMADLRDQVSQLSQRSAELRGQLALAQRRLEEANEKIEQLKGQIEGRKESKQ